MTTITLTNPIKRGPIRTTIGVEVDELEVSLLCNSSTVVGNIPVAQFAAQGGFDGARLEVTRNFSASWVDEACGTLNLFTGRVADVTVTGTETTLKIVSDLELLNVQLPRNLYQASCLHTLYDTGCALSAGAFTVTSAAEANCTRNVVTSNLAQADGYFDQGTVTFTSGLNDRETRTVKSYANGTLTVVFPFPYTPAPGDSFTAKPGCDKTLSTCTSKFSNSDNFRGFPFIPVPEASY